MVSSPFRLSSRSLSIYIHTYKICIYTYTHKRRLEHVRGGDCAWGQAEIVRLGSPLALYEDMYAQGIFKGALCA